MYNFLKSVFFVSALALISVALLVSCAPKKTFELTEAHLDRTAIDFDPGSFCSCDEAFDAYLNTVADATEADGGAAIELCRRLSGK